MAMTTPNDGEDATMRIYAWLAFNEYGVEGVLLSRSAGGSHMPLVSTDKEQALRLSTAAKRVGMQSGTTVRLVQFDRGMTIQIEEWRNQR